MLIANSETAEIETNIVVGFLKAYVCRTEKSFNGHEIRGSAKSIL
jgi:hypothetical protein